MQSAAGIALILTFNILQAGSAVFLSSFLHKADTLVVLFSVFTVIAVTFNIFLFAKGGANLRQLKGAWGLVLLLNLTTAASWSSFFFAVKHIEPALSSAFINSILPLATIAVEFAMMRRRFSSAAEVAIACALCVAMLLTAATVFTGKSGGPMQDPSSYLIGLGMSAVCGMAMSFTNVASKKLNVAGVSPSQIMAYRFTLLIVLAAALSDKQLLFTQIPAFWHEILFVAVVGNLIPIFALQLGIERLKPVAVSFLIGLAPLTFLVVQQLNKDLRFSWLTLGCILITTVIILAGTYVSLVKTRERSKTAGA